MLYNLIFKDGSQLCSLIKSSFILYQSAGFEHSRFMEWIDLELRHILLTNNGNGDDSIDALKSELEHTKIVLYQIISTALDGERPLVSFINKSNLDNIAEHVLELLVI